VAGFVADAGPRGAAKRHVEIAGPDRAPFDEIVAAI
jgi:hypothetical protein